MDEPGGKSVTYAYDGANRRVAMSAYGRGIFAYQWDEANRQVQITTPALQVTSLSYEFGAPLALSVSVGNAWGSGLQRSSQSFFLEGLDLFGGAEFRRCQFAAGLPG